MIWRELEEAAPEIARLGIERLQVTGVALLGTIRRDGSPRISPVEPYLADGHLLIGLMSRSPKARDLQDDPRCVLHSTVSGPDSGEGEIKLYGQAIVASERIRGGCAGAWWIGRPPEVASVFSLDIQEAAFVDWATERGEMTVRRWTPAAGYVQRTGPYP
jgi:Pyridoxamine 5'-phosphate oxidase